VLKVTFVASSEVSKRATCSLTVRPVLGQVEFICLMQNYLQLTIL